VNGTLVVVTWSQTWDEKLDRMCIYIHIHIYIYLTMFTNLWPGDLDSVRNGGFLWPGIGGSRFGMVQPFLGFEFSTMKRGTDNVRLRVGEDAGRRLLS
jgi:hypothetical protein